MGNKIEPMFFNYGEANTNISLRSEETRTIDEIREILTDRYFNNEEENVQEEILKSLNSIQETLQKILMVVTLKDYK